MGMMPCLDEFVGCRVEWFTLTRSLIPFNMAVQLFSWRSKGDNFQTSRIPESSVRACLNEMIEWTPNEICWSLSIYYNERDNTVAVYTCGKGTAAIWVRTKTKQNGCWAEYSIGIRYSRLSLFNALKQNVNKFRNLIHYFPFQLIPKLFCSRKTPVKNGTIWNMEWHIKTWW